MATLARLQRQVAQADERKNRRIFVSTAPVELYKVVDDRQSAMAKGEYFQILLDPSPHATMAEVQIGSTSWMLTGINHTLRSVSRRGEPTYVFNDVDDLHPDVFYAVIFPKDSDEAELSQLESILRRFTMYHVSDRKKEPSNPFLPDPDQVIGAVAKGIGAMFGLGGSKAHHTPSSSNADKRAAARPGTQAEEEGRWQGDGTRIPGARGYPEDNPRGGPAYPWGAAGVPERDQDPSALLHRADATVGRAADPHFNTYEVEPRYGGSQQQQQRGGGTVPGSTPIKVTERDRQQAAARVAALKAELSESADSLPTAPPLPAKEPGWLGGDQQGRQHRGYPTAAADAPQGIDDWGPAPGHYGARGTTGAAYSKHQQQQDDEVEQLRRQAAEARDAWAAAQQQMDQAAARQEQEEQRRQRHQERKQKVPDWQKVMQGLFSAGVPVYHGPDL